MNDNDVIDEICRLLEKIRKEKLSGKIIYKLYLHQGGIRDSKLSKEIYIKKTKKNPDSY